MSFVPVYWYWIAALFLGFLPIEVYAARSKRDFCRGGTFSEFIWWSFGVKRRVVMVPFVTPPARRGDYYLELRSVPFALARRMILGFMCVSLTAHFVFGVTVLPVIVFGALVGVVFIRALGWEREKTLAPADWALLHAQRRSEDA